MARFEETKLFTDSVLETRKCYLVNGYLTIEDVNSLNSVNDPLFLILVNTRGQNGNIIGMLDSNKVSISIVGGIDYIRSNKIVSDEDVIRTIYSPRSLHNIIDIYEEIERNIDSSWLSNQKCMYVYKTLVETMHYSLDEEIENNEIISSNLNGLIYRKANHLGMSLIFKEAMDRLDIECSCQYKDDEYSWNVVKLNDEYRGIDITWEMCNKSSDGRCSFKYYCRLDGTKFYENPHHDILNNTGEVRYPIKALDDNVLLTDLEKVLKSNFMISGAMTYYKNSKGEEFYYLLLGESFGHLVYVVRLNDYINYFYVDKGTDIRKVLDNEKLGLACSKYAHNINGGELSDSVKKFSRYMREDGSNFLICYSNTRKIGNIKSYILIEPYTINGKEVLIRSKIFSENDLVNLKSSKYKNLIANTLLGKNRLKKRIDNFNGYVGYIKENAVLTNVANS